MPLSNQQPGPKTPAETYQLKTATVTARQYDGSDESGTEIFRWVALESVTTDPDLVLHSLWDSRGIQILTLDGPLFLEDGDWCVLIPPNRFIVLSPESFEERYEPAPARPAPTPSPDPDPTADLPPG
jgi:hypothetical protein